jgi:hypothetical protein
MTHECLIRCVLIISFSAFLAANAMFCLGDAQASEQDGRGYHSDYGYVNRYVYDYADMIDQHTEDYINSVIDAMQNNRGYQVIIVTADALKDGADIKETYKALLERITGDDENREMSLAVIFDKHDKKTYFVKLRDDCGMPYSSILSLYKERSILITNEAYENFFVLLTEGIRDETGNFLDNGIKCLDNREPVVVKVSKPKDTPCTDGWNPGDLGIGPVRGIYKGDWCDIFEVADSDLFGIAEEAYECCASGCSDPECHKFCSKAYSETGPATKYSEDAAKKCAGLYIIYGLGPGKKWLKNYYMEEIMCFQACGREGSPCNVAGGTDNNVSCADGSSDATEEMKCRSPKSSTVSALYMYDMWASDTDMSSNSCFLSAIPASASILILKTGTCKDYSVALTTLLRIAGYSHKEVYTVKSNWKGNEMELPDGSVMKNAQHAYNIVKFPGDKWYTVVDTTGNQYDPLKTRRNSIFLGDDPSKIYCKMTDCRNDNGISGYRLLSPEERVSEYERSCPPVTDILACS